MKALRRLLGRVASALDRPDRASAAIDLEDPAVSIDPYPWYEKLRGEGDVVYLPRHDFWLVLGYDAVKEALAQPNLFSSAPYSYVDPTMLAADPPHHAPVRRLVSPEFGGQTLRRLEALAEATGRQRLKPRLDIVADFARPVSRAVAADLIGFDSEALAAVVRAEAQDFPELVAALDSNAERSSMFASLAEGGRDLLEPDGPRNLVRLLWLASTATTERTIAHAVLALVQDEPLQVRLRREPRLIPGFLEEVVRLNPPEILIRRVTTAPATLAGVPLPAGASVQLCLAAANRDPARFEAPAALRPERPSAANLSFGSGIHRCIGAPLTRRTVKAAISVLLDGSAAIRPVRPLAETEFVHAMIVRAPRTLEVTL